MLGTWRAVRNSCQTGVGSLHPFIWRYLSTLLRADVNFPAKTLVRWLFVEADLNDLLCMHDEANRSWAMAMKRARMFLAAHEVWRWVHVQNLVHGVAPSAAEVFDRFVSRTASLIPSGLPRERTVNKWAARWRARWDVRQGRLRPTDQINPEDLRQKAWGIVICGPIFGTAWRSRKWDFFLLGNPTM